MKLRALFHDPFAWRDVLRSKGHFWVGGDHHIAYERAQAGGVGHVGLKWVWWAAVPRERWDMPDDDRPERQPEWHARYSDRVPKTVVIGQGVDVAELRARFDARLVPLALADLDSGAWAGLPNPFPVFPAAGELADAAEFPNPGKPDPRNRTSLAKRCRSTGRVEGLEQLGYDLARNLRPCRR